jgi:hypothetical protein
MHALSFFFPLEPEQVMNITQAMMKSLAQQRENNNAEDLDLVNACITSTTCYDKGPVCMGPTPAEMCRTDGHQAVGTTHAGASLPCIYIV